METLPSCYDSPLNYRYLLKEYINHCFKKGIVEDIFFDKALSVAIESLGYDVSEEEYELLNKWFNSITNISFLEDICSYYGGSHIEEVILHSPKWVQIIGKKRKEFFGPFLTLEDFQFSLETLASKNGLLWNTSTPFQSFQTKVGKKQWRATLVHYSLCGSKNSKLFLRNQNKEHFPLKQFNLTQGQEVFIRECINKKKNLLICGATGSGKTSLMRSLLEELPNREHLITIEDTNELKLSTPFCTPLISQNKDGKSMVDFCQYALRMRPDRIIIGEIRGKEVIPFLLSMNTGHRGIMASLHANSALDSIQRLSLLFQIYSNNKGISYQEVLKLICRGIDFVLYIENKKIETILEIKGCEGITPFYEIWN